MDKQLNEYNEALAKLSDADKERVIALTHSLDRLIELSEKMKLEKNENIRNIRNNRH